VVEGELTDRQSRLRHELGLLYSEVALELRRRNRRAARRVPRRLPTPDFLRDLQKDAPTLAVEYVVELAALLRQLTGREVIDLKALMDMAMFVYRQQKLARRGPDYEIDDFGFDREWTESLLPVFRWIYHRYWQVETTGIENVPADGRALLVSNHAGVLPWDGAMIKTALFEEHSHPRHARALVASFFFTLPMLSWFLRRTGQTVGHPDDSLRLLLRDQLVLVFPEGVKGTGKPWSERYRLRRFGRGGFVQTAIRGQAPIVPISVVGSEEIYPMVGDLAPVARLFGFPYFPVTPTWPWLGALGLVPLPSKWRIQFHEPIPTERLDPEMADDQNLVMTISDQVRDTIQQGLYDNLRLRRGIFY
jgi:1-acyl-sn-glycerol-3-phosphate acyltransferase